MNKAEYLNIIEKNVRDEAKSFVKTAVISLKSYGSGITTFTVDTTEGFYAGDSIYMKDSSSVFFGVIFEIDETNNYIKISSDLTAFEIGTQIKKNDAEQYLNNALLAFSKFRPHIKSHNKIGLSSAQTIAMPTDWEQGFSSIKDIRFPISVSSVDYIDNRYYRVEFDETDYKIFLDYAITGDARIYYTVIHSFGSASPYSATVPNADAYCVCDIASAYYLLALASRYAQSTNDSIGADVVNYDQKPNQYIALYNMYLNKAAMHLNIDVEQLKKGGAIDEAYSSNQEMDEEATDDSVLIKTNYLNQ